MQTGLFEHKEPLGLSIEQAANLLANVSKAAIRNWIKTGYLTPIDKRLIDKNSFNRLMSEVVGKDKLVFRANKSHKDEHDHHKLSELVRRGINTEDLA